MDWAKKVALADLGFIVDEEGDVLGHLGIDPGLDERVALGTLVWTVNEPTADWLNWLVMPRLSSMYSCCHEALTCGVRTKGP